METNTRLWLVVALLALVNAVVIGQFINVQHQFNELSYEHYTYRLLILTGMKPVKAVRLSVRGQR